MKIKFVSNGPNGEVYHGETYVNPAYFFIKAFYMLHGKTADVEWLPCDFTMLDTYEVQLEQIINDKPDVVALSVYVWNESHQLRLARDIKSALPDTLIVLGGPQLIAHKEPDYFDRHPYVDYVCYGDGELAFQLLIDRHSGALPASTELINMVENLKPGYKLWPFEIIADKTYLETSSFLIQKDDVTNSVNSLIERGIPKNKIVMAIEFARGCMYSCSFCDWSQNLTKKVKRRSHDWKAELDFFHELDIMVREADANFGQWPEDLKIFDYGISLYDPKRIFKFRVHNTPKLKKEATYHLMYTQSLLYDFRAHVSLQDIDDQVLANINRPSVSWEQHVELIQRLSNNLPEGKKHLVGVQLIIGLPGQTYKSIIRMYQELYRIGVRQGAVNLWVYLDNSPAAEPAYQRLHKLKWIDAYVLIKPELEVNNLDKLYADLAAGDVDPNVWTKLKIVRENSSMKFKDIMKAQLFRQYFSKLTGGLDKPTLTEDELQALTTELNQRVDAEVTESLTAYADCMEKYDLVTFGTYSNNKIKRVYVD